MGEPVGDPRHRDKVRVTVTVEYIQPNGYRGKSVTRGIYVDRSQLEDAGAQYNVYDDLADSVFSAIIEYRKLP